LVETSRGHATTARGGEERTAADNWCSAPALSGLPQDRQGGAGREQGDGSSAARACEATARPYQLAAGPRGVRPTIYFQHVAFLHPKNDRVEILFLVFS